VAQAGDVPPVVQAGGKREALDRATVQAVVDLRAALRAVDALEHEDLGERAEAYRRAHAKDVAAARVRHLSARSTLELVLLGDE
jgi:hypothetical protein